MPLPLGGPPDLFERGSPGGRAAGPELQGAEREAGLEAGGDETEPVRLGDRRTQPVERRPGGRRGAGRGHRRGHEDLQIGVLARLGEGGGAAGGRARGPGPAQGQQGLGQQRQRPRLIAGQPSLAVPLRPLAGETLGLPRLPRHQGEASEVQADLGGEQRRPSRLGQPQRVRQALAAGGEVAGGDLDPSLPLQRRGAHQRRPDLPGEPPLLGREPLGGREVAPLIGQVG